jgi:hypothetical protein
MKFEQYVEKDLSREMFCDSLDLKIIKEFDTWMQASCDNNSKSTEDSLMDVKQDENEIVKETKTDKSDNTDNEELTQKEKHEASKYIIQKRLVSEEKVLIDTKTMLNSNFNQIDIVMKVKEHDAEELFESIKDPLIISLTFKCEIFKSAKNVNYAKESSFLKTKILNSKSSKKEKFCSRKSFKKFMRSLSSDEKPAPFKFQSNITNFFNVKKLSGKKKKMFIKKEKIGEGDDAMKVVTPQVLSSFMTPVVHFDLPEVNNSSKIMVMLILLYVICYGCCCCCCCCYYYFFLDFLLWLLLLFFF